MDAHAIALRFGGLPGVKREADILSAIGRPYIGYFRAIHRKAAALLQSVARNHGFNDGNKRTAVLLTDRLIKKSGYALKPYRREDLDTAVADLVLWVVNEDPHVDEIAEWFRKRVARPQRRILVS